MRFGRKSSLNSQLCSLEDIVDLTISILKHTAQKQNVLLNVEHNENATAYADSQSIEQVCFNLIKNAIESGATQVTVRTSLGHISVEDDGEGMDDETLRQVFDPFFTTKEIGEGSGLGLSVSYGIVERHGGQLKATSSPSVGNLFYCDPPYRGRNMSPQRVLVVDDEPELLRSISRILGHEGFEVSTANCAEEALLGLQQSLSPDLIVSDLMMPESAASNCSK